MPLGADRGRRPNPLGAYGGVDAAAAAQPRGENIRRGCRRTPSQLKGSPFYAAPPHRPTFLT